MMLEAHDDRKRATEAFKQAILSADPAKYMPLLYPEMKPDPENVDDVSDEEIAGDPGEYRFADQIAPAEAAEMLSRMLTQPSGSMKMTDFEQFDE